MKIHPAAEIFPMMDDGELAALAEDIKANGLQMPIVVKDGVLIDGRNRLKACEMAGVEPATRELNGQDPEAFIISSNIARRHMTKGQRAMAVAMIYPDADKGGRGKKSPAQTSAKSGGFSMDMIDRARTVFPHTDLAAAVMRVKDPMPLSDAYAEAHRRAIESTKPVDEGERLRQRYADLADAVQDGEMTMPRAHQQAAERDELAESKRRAWSDIIRTTISISNAMAHPATLEEIRTAIRDDDKTRGELAPFFKGQDAESLRDTLEHAMANLLLIWGDLKRKAKQ